jgi:hypothetical protein
MARTKQSGLRVRARRSFVETPEFRGDVPGLARMGGVVVTANKPTFGRAVIARQWANAKRKIGVDVMAELRTFNGELAIVVRLAMQRDVVVAVVHLETRGRQVVALRVNRDPRSTAPLAMSVN